MNENLIPPSPHPPRRPSRGILGIKSPPGAPPPAPSFLAPKPTPSGPAGSVPLDGCGFCTEVASHVGFIDRKTDQPPTIANADEGFAVIDRIQSLKRWLQAVEYVAVAETAKHALTQKNPKLTPDQVDASYLLDSKHDWVIKNFISTLATRLGLEFAQGRRILRDGLYFSTELTETANSLRRGEISIAQAREIAFQHDALRHAASAPQAGPMSATNKEPQQGQLPLTPQTSDGLPSPGNLFVPDGEPATASHLAGAGQLSPQEGAAPQGESATHPHTGSLSPSVPEALAQHSSSPAVPERTQRTKELEAELLGAAKHYGGRRFKNHARNLREQKAPESKTSRARTAIRQRQVSITNAGDGMGRLTAYMSLDKLAMLDAELDARTRSILRRGETRQGRSYKQIKVDELAQILLLGAGAIAPPSVHAEAEPNSAPVIEAEEQLGQPVLSGLEDYATDTSAAAADRALIPRNGLGARAKIIVTIPIELIIAAGSYVCGSILKGAERLHPALQRMAELNRERIDRGEEPFTGQLPYALPSPEAHGYGPISPQAAIELAAQAQQWTTILTEPVGGKPIGLGKKNYRPNQLMRTLLQLRDQFCRIPGCQKPAIACEIDHVQNWANDGDTDLTNLWHLCHEHHALKTAGVWKFRPAIKGGPGDLEILLPDGRVLSSPSPTFEAGRRYADP